MAKPEVCDIWRGIKARKKEKKPKEISYHHGRTGEKKVLLTILSRPWGLVKRPKSRIRKISYF